MIIRHAEKPKNGTLGVSEEGNMDPEELTVKGWQRAGALVRFFNPPDHSPGSPGIEKPDVIFASAVEKHSNSKRPQHTVLPLARSLHITIQTNDAKNDVAALASDVLKEFSKNRNVLICWEHELIPQIATQIAGNGACPQKWPDSSFDRVWILDRSTDGERWTFSEVRQMLLPDDSTE